MERSDGQRDPRHRTRHARPLRVPPARRPDWWPDPDWDLERVAIERVVRHLEAEDRSITGLWYPDHDRDYARIAGRTTPEAAVRIDGHEAAIEVTHAWPPPRGDAAFRATSTGRRIKAHLQEVRPALSIHVFGEFEIDAIMARRGGVEELEAAAIADAVVEIADRGPCYQVPVAADRLPRWIDFARVTRTTVVPDMPASVSVLLLARSDRPGHVADVLNFVTEVKAPKLADWGLGIVVLIPGWSDLADDLAAALALRPDWPLWRVYWLNPGDIRLVWQSQAPVGPSEAGRPKT